MSQPIHAWDCGCGTRNSLQFSQCRNCGRARETAAPFSITRRERPNAAGDVKLCPECRMENRVDASQCVCGHPFGRIVTGQPAAPPSGPSTMVAATGAPHPPQAIQQYQAPTYSQPPVYHLPGQPQPPVMYQQPYPIPYNVPQPLYYGPGYVSAIPGVHSSGAAVAWAFFITGAGQFYNKQAGKGALLLVGAMISAWPTMFIGPLVLAVIGMIDAGAIAGKLHRGQPVREWDWF